MERVQRAHREVERVQWHTEEWKRYKGTQRGGKGGKGTKGTQRGGKQCFIIIVLTLTALPLVN